MLLEIGLGLAAICSLLGDHDDDDHNSHRHHDDDYYDRRKQESFNSRMYDELYG